MTICFKCNEVYFDGNKIFGDKPKITGCKQWVKVCGGVLLHEVTTYCNECAFNDLTQYCEVYLIRTDSKEF